MGAQMADFIGKSALLAATITNKLVGLVLLDRGMLHGQQKVIFIHDEGKVTSGGFSHTLGKSIALARVPDSVQIGDTVQIAISEKLLEAKIVKYPFAKNGNSLIG